MKDKVEPLLDKLVDEVLAVHQFYLDMSIRQCPPRFTAISKFVDRIMLLFDHVAIFDKPTISELFIRCHRKKNRSVISDEFKSDKEFLLRNLEIKIFGDDLIFQSACMEKGKQHHDRPTNHEFNDSLDNQLNQLLSDFDEIGVSFNTGDIWCIAGTEYCVASTFALADLWLLQDKEKLIRLRELIPLQLGDFKRIGS